MSRIAINDLNQTKSHLNTVSNLEEVHIVGGREVYYVDTTGDGIADYKVVVRNNGSGRWKEL